MNSNHDLPAQDYTGRLFIGQVVANNDPRHRHRIKVTIENLFTVPPYTLDTLPWVIPKTAPGSVGDTYGHQDVPDVGSYVYVEFEHGKIAYPRYLGGANQRMNVDVLAVNYPHRRGWKDRKGNHFYVDKATDDIELRHKSGTTVHIAPNGAVHLTLAADLTIDGTTMTLNASTSVTINSPSVSVNP